MYKDKRGQAAMEFLITYGWAILAAIVAIGVLAYFLVSPGRYVPSQCTLNAPFSCNAGTANTSGVTLEIRNGGGETLTLQSIAVTGCGTLDLTTGGGVDVADGALSVQTVSCTLAAGKFKGDITVTYRKAGSSLDQKSTGTIVQVIG